LDGTPGSGTPLAAYADRRPVGGFKTGRKPVLSERKFDSSSKRPARKTDGRSVRHRQAQQVQRRHQAMS